VNLDRRTEERLGYVEERVRILQLQMQAEAKIRHRDRRERIATACLAGMLAKPLSRDTTDLQIAAFAVILADALIAELDKPKEVKP
jgi:hypothetical protein